MYKILVVDDEEWIRKGIIAKLEYNGFRFSWVGEASNGEDALQVITNEHPHIVVTDIRMNNMDGIALIREAREIHPAVKFIIITGYAEFEYAEQALNMGVMGYILKPVTDQNIVENIKKAIAELDKENEIYRMRESKEILVREKDSLKLERLLNQILHSSYGADEENLSEHAMIPGTEDKSRYILALFHIDSNNYFNSSFKYQDLELIKFSIKNIVGEIGAVGNVLVFDNQKDINQVFVLVYDQDENTLKDRSSRLIFDSFNKIWKYLKISVTVSSSNIESRITGDLYKQARAALDLRFSFGSNRVFKYENVRTDKKYVLPEHKFKLFQNCLETHDFKNVEIALNNIFCDEDLKESSGVSIRLVYNEVVSILLKACNKLDVNPEQEFDIDFQTGEVLDDFNNVKDIVSYLYTTVLDVFKAEALSNFDCKGIIARARDYMEKNCFEELTVKNLAQKFAISPNYFSSMFKKETGESVKNYITCSRVEKACSMLKETNFSISEISQSVGYKDDQYFYRVFKKAKGVTPFEYRNSLDKNC